MRIPPPSLSAQVVGSLEGRPVEYHLTQIYAQLQVNMDASVNARVQAAMIYADKERDD